MQLNQVSILALQGFSEAMTSPYFRDFVSPQFQAHMAPNMVATSNQNELIAVALKIIEECVVAAKPEGYVERIRQLSKVRVNAD